MTIVRKLTQRKKQVQRADHVVHLRESRVAPVNHRVWRGTLLGKMDHSLGLEFPNRFSEKLVISHVSNEKFDALAGVCMPGAKAVGQRTNRRQRLYAELEIPLPAHEVVDDRDRVPFLREV